MGLLDDIKNQVKKSGSNKGKFLYFKPGVKIRVRFLQDMDEGLKVLFHDSYAAGINIPCQEVLGRDCGHCDNEDLRHRDMYMWSVWDYESKEVKILISAVNNCSPIPSLVAMYDTYGTLTDRDYVITKQGTGTTATFSVVPMDKVKFKNKDAKAFSESKTLSLLDKAYPDTIETDDEDDEKPKKKKNSKAGNKKGKGRKVEEDEDDEDDEEEEEIKPKKGKKKPEPEEDEDDEEQDYEDMSAKELYKLCKEREIKVKPKMDEEYYIEKLEADDLANDEEDEEDEW